MESNIIIFYMTLLQVIFNDFREINVDFSMKLPKYIAAKNDIILKTKDDDFIYLRIQENNQIDEFNLILKFCIELKDKCSCNLDLYVLCKPEVNLNIFKKIDNNEIKLKVVNCNYIDGDVMLDLLNSKLNNKEHFTSFDMLSIILLPFLGSYDVDTFQLAVHKFLLDLEKCNY